MGTRTEMARIADELSAIATDHSAPIDLARISLLSQLADRLEVVIESAYEDALLEAARAA